MPLDSGPGSLSQIHRSICIIAVLDSRSNRVTLQSLAPVGDHPILFRLPLRPGTETSSPSSARWAVTHNLRFCSRLRRGSSTTISLRLKQFMPLGGRWPARNLASTVGMTCPVNRYFLRGMCHLVGESGLPHAVTEFVNNPNGTQCSVTLTLLSETNTGCQALPILGPE